MERYFNAIFAYSAQVSVLKWRNSRTCAAEQNIDGIWSRRKRKSPGKKKPRGTGFLVLLLIVLRLGGLNVGCLLAFRALRDFERNLLTFFEGLEAVHLDCGEVSEQIFAAVIRSDKSEAFGVIEPLDGTCCHKSVFQIITNHTSRKSKKLRVTLPLLELAHFVLTIA